MPVLLNPVVVNLIIAGASYGIGHIVGWFHKKHSNKKAVEKLIQASNKE